MARPGGGSAVGGSAVGGYGAAERRQRGRRPKIGAVEAVRDSGVVITTGCGVALGGITIMRTNPVDVASADLSSVAVRRQPAGLDAVRIAAMLPRHAPEVLAIYRAGIDEGNATFETRAPDWEEFSAARLPDHRYVAMSGNGTVLGWVAVCPVSTRCVYSGVVEHSVYVHPGARGQRVGSRLLAALIASTEAAGIWTIQSGIFPENAASAVLHRSAGFRVVGVRERLGRQHGRWRDILLLERRSPVI